MGFVDQMIERSKGYIEQSAQDASEYFSKHKIEHRMFERTRMILSPKDCENIYVGMIRDVIEAKVNVSCKYGLMVALLPIQQEDNIVITLYCGVTFPDREHPDNKPGSMSG